MAVYWTRYLLNSKKGAGLKDIYKTRALLTTLLSTTAVAAAQNWGSFSVRQPSLKAACCYPATYSSLASHWIKQNCLASDLIERQHTAKFTDRSAPSRSLSSGYSSDDEDEERCLQWYDIDTLEFVQLVDKKEVQLFDVREPEELEETGIIPGAVNLPRKLAMVQMQCTRLLLISSFQYKARQTVLIL